jgi:hypothetical protein
MGMVLDIGDGPLDRRRGLGLWIIKRLCEELHNEIAATALLGGAPRWIEMLTSSRKSSSRVSGASPDKTFTVLLRCGSIAISAWVWTLVTALVRGSHGWYTEAA